MARRPKKKKISKAEQRSMRRQDAIRAEQGEVVVEVAPKAEQPKRAITLPGAIVVRDLATHIDVPVGKVIGELVKNGIMATLNDSIDYDTAAIVVDELGFEATRESAEQNDEKQTVAEAKTSSAKKEARPPIVTVMGHVDHGKTRLLDAIRQTNVVAQESGGITQHIGAYQVKAKDRQITFLDTPGHEAFAALRAHGANITDIVILVVAASEGVRPQTIEALSHARAANVPIIVALTKIDLPDTNLDRVKKELSEHGLIPEEWGGKTTMVPVSAKTGENIDQLLDMILLVADLTDLKAAVERRAVGVVIDANLRPGLGPLATLLIQEGTLRVGDAITVGKTYGKVRVMQDWRGKKVDTAIPGMPVQIAGLKEVPTFGDRFRAVTDEKTARTLVQTKSAVRKTLTIGGFAHGQEGDTRELPIILKADVPGSLNAIQTSLEALNSQEVAVRFIQTGIGPVSDSDINLAETAGALVLAFRVAVLPSAKRLANEKKVTISSYDIIYQLIDEVTAGLSELLPPEIVEVKLGKLSVLKVFKASGSDIVAGGRVLDGVLARDNQARVMRNGKSIGEGRIRTIQREKDSVASIQKGFECGVGLEGIRDLKAGDEIIAYTTEERKRKLLPGAIDEVGE